MAKRPASNDKTNKPSTLHWVAQVYQFWALDYVIELVRAIAQNYTEKPTRFRSLPADVQGVLSDFQKRLGVDPSFPNFVQRRSVYEAQLGDWFHEASTGFRATVVAFIERTPDAARDTAVHAVRDAVRSVRAQLSHRDGAAAQNERAQIALMFSKALIVLRSEETARAFGLRAAPSETWPFDGALDPSGAEMVEFVAGELFPNIPGRMSGYKFLLLQRAAHHGAATLTGLMAEESRSPGLLEQVLSSAYAWATSVRELMPLSNIAMAWKWEYYRRALSGFEQSLIPDHPSGEVEFTGTELQAAVVRTNLAWGALAGAGALMTNTLGSEVCCSTGDLSCRTDASCLSIVEHCPTEGGCPTDGFCPPGSPHHHCFI